MFKQYTKRGCQFECRLRDAAAYASCIPWDYPVPKDLEGIEICLTMLNSVDHVNGTTSPMGKFHSRIDDPRSLQNCTCLPDCEEITYKTQERQLIVLGSENVSKIMQKIIASRLTQRN